MTNLFGGLFDTASASVISVADFLICVIAALLIGAGIAAIYSYKSTYTKSFLGTLILLPAIVCVVIMMVNGNVGAGVAVAGAFSLVRFRSQPGSAKEISGIFLAMAVGLICGMGYIAYAVLFALILCAVILLCSRLSFGTKKAPRSKTIRVTIPEDLDYTGIFDDLFEKYTDSCSLTQVKTTNLGSLFRLTYEVELKSDINEKALIDDLRCRNGNLEITVSNTGTVSAEL